MDSLLDEDSLFGSDDEAAGTDKAEDGGKRKGGEAGVAAAGADKGAPSGDDRKAMFRKELRSMLYGFGDEKVPFEETLEVLEQIVVSYVRELSARAMEVGKSGKLALEDIHYLIRRDAKKFGRVKDLLSMSEELKRARKAFDEAKAAL